MSVSYRQTAIPVLWEVAGRKGNLPAAAAVALVKRFVAEFGSQIIRRIYADREFGTKELFGYLIAEEIDFRIRLKISHKSAVSSFRQLWETVAERVKLRGKISIEVFGLEVFVSLVKYRKNSKTEYLIVASGAAHKYAIEEYKVRRQIETMFGCLKSRGFNFEETHLTEPKKISKPLLLLGLGLCPAMLTGEF